MTRADLSPRLNLKYYAKQFAQGKFEAAGAAFLSRYRPADQEARSAQKEKWQEARRRRGPVVGVEPWE